MPIKTGERIPAVMLKTKGENGVQDISTEELFAGKLVALFALPGAFTPTCSAKHLPGFVENAAAIKAKGADLIVCLSVNDAFVMGAWGEAQGVGDDVLMLADGNGEFTKGVDLALDATGFGMGSRSQRYSMIIEDGVVSTLNTEKPGGFGASSADTLLGQL